MMRTASKFSLALLGTLSFSFSACAAETPQSVAAPLAAAAAEVKAGFDAKVRIAADIPDAERPRIQTLKVNSPAFDQYLSSQKNESGEYPDICDIAIPSRKL